MQEETQGHKDTEVPFKLLRNVAASWMAPDAAARTYTINLISIKGWT